MVMDELLLFLINNMTKNSIIKLGILGPPYEVLTVQI